MRCLGLAFKQVGSTFQSLRAQHGLIGEVQIVFGFVGLRQGPRWLTEVVQTMVLSGWVDQMGLAIGVFPRP